MRTRSNRSSLGHAHNRSKVYRSWESMKRRCANPNAHNYEFYGGRGIKVCERWFSFMNFLEDMGEPPGGFTLDRVDAEGDYCPANCKWSSLVEQARNKRSNIFYTCFGETKTVPQWAEDPRCKVTKAALYGRVYRGWDFEDSITKPNDPRGGRK